jgi:CubicO group peptidase (beta-lactamase class C family)
VTNETGHDSFRAMGFGGQLIQVIPHLDLVVVITSDADQERHDAANLVGAAIVPAVTGQLLPQAGHAPVLPHLSGRSA